MGGEISGIQKEIERTRERLRDLRRKLERAKAGYVTEEERIRQVEAELKAKYPNANPDRELLSMVGTLPKPGVKYKEAVRRVVAERYAR